MSWKTIVVQKTDRLFLKDGQLAFEKTKKVQKIPIADLNTVVFDNNYTYITVQLLSKLAESGVFVFVCNEKHDPNGVFLPFNVHSKLLSTFELQTRIKQPVKKRLWLRIVKANILNQASVLENLKYEKKHIEEFSFLAKQIISNDKTNREAVATKEFYRLLYGSNFIRHADDGINSAINFGIKIILSAITRTLVRYGFQTYLGLNHSGKTNPFNLSYDLVEPFRPLVHYHIQLMGERIGDTLDYNQRLNLIKTLNYQVKMNDDQYTVTHAIEVMVKSLVSALKTGDTDKFITPTLCYENNKYYSGGNK